MDSAIFLGYFLVRKLLLKIAVKLRSEQIVCSLIAIIVASFAAYRFREPLVPFFNYIPFSKCHFQLLVYFVIRNTIREWLSKVTFYSVLLRIFLPISFTKNGTIHRKISYFVFFHFFAQNDFENEFSYFSTLIYPDWKLFTI